MQERAAQLAPEMARENHHKALGMVLWALATLSKGCPAPPVMAALTAAENGANVVVADLNAAKAADAMLDLRLLPDQLQRGLRGTTPKNSKQSEWL